MIFAFIEAEKASFPIRFMCARLGVSTSGFYDWRHAQANPCRRRVEDAELVERIRDIHRMSRRAYGSPRVHAELRLGEGRRHGRKRIERLMRDHGIGGIHRRRRGCTRRDPDATPADDLVDRHFDPTEPDRLWVADVTEHPTATGKVYLAVVLDAYSRLVLGWSIADHMRAELVVDALQMAIWRRRPPAGRTVHHSDHGSQGGFTWSSQHLDHGGVVDDDARTSTSGAALSGADPVARSADGGLAAGPGAVLGGDRAGPQFGGRGARDRGVIRGRSALVSSRWRRGSQPRPDGVGPLPVVC
jgi:hypothetical protein